MEIKNDPKYAELLAYIKENKGWSLAEERVALDRINSMRCSINEASYEITDQIRDLIDDFCVDNDLSDDYFDDVDFDDIFFDLE